jgi:hypothetical protein
VDAYSAAERAHQGTSGTNGTVPHGKAKGHQNGAASPKPSKTKTPK